MTRMKTIAAAISTIGLVGIALPAHAGEVEDLKATMKKMMERIEQLEAKQKTQAAAPQAATPSNAVVAGDIPGSFKVPGTDTSVKLYAYAQLDATYDIKGRNGDIEGNDWASIVAAQPLNKNLKGNTHKGQLYTTVRTSRIGLESSTPTEQGNLKVKVEGDFNGPNDRQGETFTNSSQFRIRHAYGELGNWLVGQTWSNFADLGSYADSVDYNGPGTVAQIRQPQVRYTMPVSAASKLALSVENPQSGTGIDSTKLPDAKNYDKVPDFIANFTTSGDKGHFSARAVTHQFRNDNHNKQGYGVGAGGSYKFGKDTLVAQINGGKGIGRYMMNAGATGQNAYDDGSQIHLWKAVGAHIGYTHVWDAKVRSNLIFAHTKFSGDGFLETNDKTNNKKISEAYLNTFWAVAKNTEVGLEYAYGKRTDYNGDAGTQSRINATVHYNLF